MIQSLALLITLFLFAFPEARASEVALNFQVETDSLCFKNKDPRLENYGPLGEYGTRTGVCQGMAGATAAFAENVTFAPREEKLSSDETKKLLDQIVKQHSGNCRTARTVPGYKNLREFCEANVELFMKKSITYNADIAVREIASHLPQFLSLKAKPIKNRRQQKQLKETLDKFWKRLEAGKAPLMLVYSHVTNIVEMKRDTGANGLETVLIRHYDNNDNTLLKESRVALDRDGMPDLTNRMIWDVTPERGSVDCD